MGNAIICKGLRGTLFAGQDGPSTIRIEGSDLEVEVQRNSWLTGSTVYWIRDFEPDELVALATEPSLDELKDAPIRYRWP